MDYSQHHFSRERYYAFVNVFDRALTYLDKVITPENAADFGVKADFHDYLQKTNYHIHYRDAPAGENNVAQVTLHDDMESQKGKLVLIDFNSGDFEDLSKDAMGKCALQRIARAYYMQKQPGYAISQGALYTFLGAIPYFKAATGYH